MEVLVLITIPGLTPGLPGEELRHHSRKVGEGGPVPHSSVASENMSLKLRF